MSIGKCLVRRSTYVLTEPIIIIRILLLPIILIVVHHHFIVKNPAPKPKMSNSFELLTGPINEIQRKYEILSDLVTEYNGKVHGSQSHISSNAISLVVYYEVPEGKREEVKQRFNNHFVYNNQQNYR